MKITVKILGLMLLAVLAPRIASSATTTPQGRWEFVNISGDNTSQYNPNTNPDTGYPGAFSTYLTANGGGLTKNTTDSLICDQFSNGNVTPSWTLQANGQYKVTFTVTGNPTGTFQFIYTGTYTTSYKQDGKGNSSVTLTVMYGNYTTTGKVNACNYGSGQFVATYFPDLPLTTFKGTLDGADGSPAADQTSISTSLNLATAAQGSLAGTIDLGTMTYKGKACFVPVSASHTLNINASLSSESGMFVTFYATDKNGVQLLLAAFSANLTTDMSDPNGIPSGALNAVGAAVGEDDPNGGNSGISNDGTNNDLVVYYGITGGPCDGVGGGDAPFKAQIKSTKLPPQIPSLRRSGPGHVGGVNQRNFGPKEL